jgi:hypothetical protein
MTSNPISTNYRCPVCGLPQVEAPWGVDGLNPTFFICDCCGVEFGYEDRTLQSREAYLTRWLSNGALWFKPSKCPKNWSLVAQLDEGGISTPDDFNLPKSK